MGSRRGDGKPHLGGEGGGMCDGKGSEPNGGYTYCNGSAHHSSGSQHIGGPQIISVVPMSYWGYPSHWWSPCHTGGPHVILVPTSYTHHISGPHITLVVPLTSVVPNTLVVSVITLVVPISYWWSPYHTGGTHHISDAHYVRGPHITLVVPISDWGYPSHQ